MNTPERNKRNIEKMQELGKVYNENSEDKAQESAVNPALEDATREYPLPTARKFAWVLCGGFWLFCLGGLLFGADMNALFPFLMFSLAAAVGLQIPVFYLKRKIKDVVIAVVFALSCIGLGVSMLLNFGSGI